MQLLFPHTAYKSYPESFLTDERWDRLAKWLDTVSTHRVPRRTRPRSTTSTTGSNSSQASGHYVSCSSGTTGKSAMLAASAADMEWCRAKRPHASTWGIGCRSRRATAA